MRCITIGGWCAGLLAGCGASDLPVSEGERSDLACDALSVQLPGGRRDNVTLRRSLQDLLALYDLPSGSLPRAETANGYANPRIDGDGGMGEAFSLAWRVLVSDVVGEGVRSHATVSFPLHRVAPDAGYPSASPFRSDEYVLNYRHGSPPISWEVDLPFAATWRLSLEVSWLTGWEDADYPADPSIATWSVDGERIAEWQVAPGYDALETTEVQVPLTKGVHRLTLTPTWVGPAFTGFSTNVWQLGRFEADAPLAGSDHLQVGGREASCASDTVAECASELLLPLARRAWRSPVSTDAAQRIIDLVEQAHGAGATPEVAVELGAEFILSSPRFLMLPAANQPGERSAHQLSDALAVALWRSVPDDILLDCADSDALLDSDDPVCGLPAQVDRMLEHPRSDAMFEDFAVQWLGLEALLDIERDPSIQDDLSPQEVQRLVRSARDELRRNVLDLFARDAPVTELIESRGRWVDARLGAHYSGGALDLEVPSGVELIQTPERPGLLGSAAFLALTSQPNRTSPVKRGVYVLGRLLCDPPSPPPPGVPLLPDPEAAADSREALGSHTQDPACASCHDKIDPIGFALEGFDALGAARSSYPDGRPVNTSATLPDGSEVSGLVELSAWLAAQPEVESCVARNLFIWLQGRAPTQADAALLEQMASPEHPPTLGSMVSTWALSPQARCAVPEAGGAE